MRFYNAEAFTARVSDVAVIEAETPQDYYFAIERLRDTALIARGYFSVVEIIAAYENGFRQFGTAQHG
ncbi:darcynin family protein [Cribrihabitans pelagius]|uniref:darcynin family protein n=1 Tax=Cribrihabitans pelagius TaxID=1765746 RepID=UPI003B5CF8DE